MKLSEALRIRARMRLEGRREAPQISVAQWRHWERIRSAFNPSDHLFEWNVHAENDEHRAMILLFAACIAEDEGD